MKTNPKLALLCLALALCLPGTAPAASWTWNAAGGGSWTTAGNWNPASVPTSASTSAVAIDDLLGGGSQTVTYDITSGGSLASLALLNSAGAGFTDTLQLTGTGTSSASRLTINSALTLGSAAGTVELRLSPTAASGGQESMQSGALTINSGGLLTFDTTAQSSASASVVANVTLSGGTVSVLGSSSGMAIGNTGSPNTFTLTSGNLTFGNASNTQTAGRLQILGNFTATGGTITALGSNVIELYSGTNSISGVTYVNPSALTYSLRGAAAGQTLTSAVDLPNLLFRSGQTVGVTLTSPGKNAGTITIATTAGSAMQLGSDMNTTTNPVISIGNAGIDLNGHTLAVSDTGTFTTSTTSNLVLSSTQAGGVMQVTAFNLGSTTASSVGAGVTLQATGGGGTTDLLGAATTYNGSSRLLFSGTSSSSSVITLAVGSSGQSVGNLQVGTGTSTTYVTVGSNILHVSGNLDVLANSTLDLNGRIHTLDGNLQGTGTVQTGFGTVGLTFTSTGGLSPGTGGSGTVGALAFTGGFGTITLGSGSISQFDLAGGASFDSIAGGGDKFLFNGTLNLDLFGGYAPTAGTTWTLFTGLNTASSGTFGSITSNLAGDVFSFSIVGTTGVLTLVTAAPEPGTWALLAAGGGMLLFSVRRARRGLAV